MRKKEITTREELKLKTWNDVHWSARSNEQQEQRQRKRRIAQHRTRTASRREFDLNELSYHCTRARPANSATDNAVPIEKKCGGEGGKRNELSPTMKINKNPERVNIFNGANLTTIVEKNDKLLQYFKSNQKKAYRIIQSFSFIKRDQPFGCRQLVLALTLIVFTIADHGKNVFISAQDSTSTPVSTTSDSNAPPSSTAACFGGLQTFEKISMSSFENPSSSSSSSGNSFGSGILVQQDDQALTSECVNLCRSQSNCLSFVIDYNKFECKSYATTQQELQQEYDSKYQAARSVNSNSTENGTDSSGYQASASNVHFQHLLPSASSNYFEKICLDGVANRNQFGDVCGQGRLWSMERVVDSFLDGYVEKEVPNVNNKDECSKLCIFETQFVCRSADYDQHSRLCRLSKEDRRTQPQAIRYVPGSNRQYLENQCATPGPSSCVYETKKNVGIISMDALKFAQTVQDCQMKCNQESTFKCRSYSFHQQRCFLSGDDSTSLNSNSIKLPVKQGWHFGEKKCLVELCTKGIFSYEKITGFTLRSALSTPMDLMVPSGSSMSMTVVGNNFDDLERLQHESSQTRLRQLIPMYDPRTVNGTSNLVATMMMVAANNNPSGTADPLHESASTLRHHRSASNLAITSQCRHSCDLGYLNCPAFTVDYKNNRCQRLDRNSQGRHHELVARDGFALYEKICLRVPEIMSMCQDKYWIFERVIGYELAPRLYEKSLKFVQSRRDCEEYCLEEKQFQCRSALYNDEVSECKLSRHDRRLASQEGGYYRNFNARISYLENQCVRDHAPDKQHCTYEQAKDEPSYPTFTEHIEIIPTGPNSLSTIETESVRPAGYNSTTSARYGPSYCEQICNDNAKFECHSFGYYASTAQCFLSGDDTISAGESATTLSTGFTYYERKCKSESTSTGAPNYPTIEDPKQGQIPTIPSMSDPYFPPGHNHIGGTNMSSTTYPSDRPPTSNNQSNVHTDQQYNMGRPARPKDPLDISNDTSVEPDHYKCGVGHTFVYQRISGFEPIGGYLTLLIRNNDQPGIVSDCSELCKKAYACRAFVVDYNNNQCFAMLENSSVGMLSLRQTLGRDYFEGFCVADQLLLTGSNCRNKTWVVDKIVDQAVIGVQHQKLITDTDRVQCRQACLEERLFWCKSVMFDGSTGDCKLYSIERESTPQMRLLFTKGVDFFENQCQIVSNTCPYDAIERDMAIVSVTKSTQARSTFDCEYACNSETTFNCRSYTYLEQYPSLQNLCLLSSDSRSTSQKGSVRERQRTLYAERNCYHRRPRIPSGPSQRPDIDYGSVSPPLGLEDLYQYPGGTRTHIGHSTIDDYGPPRQLDAISTPVPTSDVGPAIGQGCEPHQYTFERTFGYDFRLGQKERAPIAPTIGIAISCQQECLRRGDRCQSFVVDYTLPYQSCFLIDTQVGANKKLLVKSPNSAYFEKLCLPRTGIDTEPAHHQSSPLASNPVDVQSMDIAPSYSNEPWSPQIPNQLPYYLQQQQLAQNYPSRSCAKLWSFERFVNHNFTAPSDKILENILTKALCETQCLNEASFSCRSATYDYSNKICRLFKNTRRTIMSLFIDLESPNTSSVAQSTNILTPSNGQHGTVQVIASEIESNQPASAPYGTTERGRRQARQISSSSTAEAPAVNKNIDYLENTCVPAPSSCQYRQLYDLFSPYIDKINHALSLSDCQRQCDSERLFSCKSINYDPTSKNCMLINEDLISLNRGQQASLLPKKNTIYSEKGNCEMISVQCTSQEMLVSINFDSPFRGRVMAKGNPEQCFLIGDGQTNIQFPIVFGPKCNSRQEGHNTFVNEVVIQQHPVIMTDSDKTVRVMCAFEAPDQTITLKNPTSRDNKTGIDVGTSESSRTRHDKQQFNSVVSNKAAPPSVLLRILDQNGRDASMINLGDDLMLKIQMQTEGQNSAFGIFARNLAAKSSNGESLLLIDNEGCPVDHQVFPALDVDPKDGKSLVSIFKAFRFPSSGLVNFEVQIRFCPERCQPIDCHRGQKMRSYGRRKRDLSSMSRTSILQSINFSQEEKNPLEVLSTVMKPGKAFQYVRELMLPPQNTDEKNEQTTQADQNLPSTIFKNPVGPDPSQSAPISGGSDDSEQQFAAVSTSSLLTTTSPLEASEDFSNQSQKREMDQSNSESSPNQQATNESMLNPNNSEIPAEIYNPTKSESGFINPAMHVDEGSSTNDGNIRSLNQPHSSAPYGRYPVSHIELHHKLQNAQAAQSIQKSPFDNEQSSTLIKEHTNTAGETRPDQIGSDGTGEDLSQHNHQQTMTQAVEQHSDVQRGNERFTAEGNTTLINRTLQSKSGSRDVPLRFSILVGENNAASNGWIPSGQAPVLVMNSSHVDLDHIVIPGSDGQFEQAPTTQSPSNYNEANLQTFPDSKAIGPGHAIDTSKRGAMYEQTFDALPSNSVEAEVKMNHLSNQVEHSEGKIRQSGSPSETAASHNCHQLESGQGRIWTIIWTGAFVITLNICLVVLSLVLYFKRVHLRQHHNIVGQSSSECGTHGSESRRRWPSVLLKSQSNLGTSLNTHEHFFCKLNSKPTGPSGVNGLEYNWPNLSSSSSHSTISSMASPLPVTSIRINQIRSHKLPFDTQSSIRNNFNTGHKSIIDGHQSYESSGNLHACSYTNNIDESHNGTHFKRYDH